MGQGPDWVSQARTSRKERTVAAKEAKAEPTPEPIHAGGYVLTERGWELLENHTDNSATK